MKRKDKASITLLHQLPNRLRVRVSNAINDLSTFINIIKLDTNHTEVRYNSVINTVTVTFDPSELFLQEILNRISTAYSIDNGLTVIKLIEEKKARSIGALTFYSAATLGIAKLYDVLSPKEEKTRELLKWLAVGTTTSAIAEHAYVEAKQKGIFDLEIIPTMYILRNYINTPKLSLAALMWLTAFGRHLVTNYQTVKDVRVARIKSKKEEGKFHYIANISESKDASNLSELIHHIINRKNQSKYLSNEKFIIEL